MYQVHRQGGDVVDGPEVVENAPRLKNVERRPANEELCHDDEQHFHRPPLGLNAVAMMIVTVERSGAFDGGDLVRHRPL